MRVTIEINDRVVCATPLGFDSTSSWKTWTGSRRRSCPPSAGQDRRSGGVAQRACLPQMAIDRGAVAVLDVRFSAARRSPSQKSHWKARRNGRHQLPWRSSVGVVWAPNRREFKVRSTDVEQPLVISQMTYAAARI
jgi:hypothetical protein